MKGYRVTGAGIALAVVFIVGAVVFFVASGTLAAIGGLVALLAVALAVADQLPAGLGGGRLLGRGRRWRPLGADPEPEYIEAAGEPTEEAWGRERQRYEEKNGPGG